MAGRKPGSVSQNPQAYRAPPRNRPAPKAPLSLAARVTTAPPRPASAMLAKYRVICSAPEVTVTWPTSIRRTRSPARCSAACAASPGRPNDLTKSHPEPAATTPSTASAASGRPPVNIPLTTSWTVPSPPTATR